MIYVAVCLEEHLQVTFMTLSVALNDIKLY